MTGSCSATRRARALAALLLACCVGCVAPQVDHAELDRTVDALQARDLLAHWEGQPALDSEFLERARARTTGMLPGASDHEVAILETGQDALVARLHLIRSATESIDFQTFSWGDDDTSHAILWEFVAAARRGVRVRLLVDQMGLGGHPEVIARVLVCDPDLEVRLYNVLSRRGRNTTETMLRNLTGNFQRMNHRMHNKMLVVDGCAAIIGGRNIDDRYFDVDVDWLYLDRDVVVSGPVVREMTRSFNDYWFDDISTPAQYLVDVSQELIELDATGAFDVQFDPTPSARLDWAYESALQPDLYDGLVRSARHDVGRVRLVVDAPRKPEVEDRGAALHTTELMGEALALTQDRLLLQSNYLVITTAGRRGLADLREERPDLEIAFSTNSLAATGAPYVYAMSRRQRRNLWRKVGMMIYELKPHPDELQHFVPRLPRLLDEDPDGSGPSVAIHSKSFVIDDDVVLIGSHNFDPRSAHYNTEAGVLIYDAAVAAELEASMRRIMAPANSWATAKKPRVPVWAQFNSFMQGISRSLPVLDVWPWRYTSAYELREGQEPVPATHPEFHERYAEVGEMPETTWRKRWTTRLTSAFAGFLEPLM